MFDDRLLIWKVKKGDEGAFRLIYQKYKDVLFTVAANLLNDDAVAENILHNVFVSFAGDIGSFHFYSDLKIVLVGRLLSHAREKIHEKMRSEAVKGDAGPIELNIQPDDGSRKTEFLAKALPHIPVQQREVMILHLLAGIRFKAIAALQDISTGTAEGRYRYGIDKLQTVLAEEGQAVDNVEHAVARLRRNTVQQADNRISAEAITVLKRSVESLQRGSVAGMALKIAAAVVLAAIILIAAGIYANRRENRAGAGKKSGFTYIGIGRKPQPPEEKQQSKLPTALEAEIASIDQMYAERDVKGLVKMLTKGQLFSQLFAAKYLGEIGDEKALKVLKQQLEIWKKNPDENPGSQFLTDAIFRIEARLQDKKPDKSKNIDKPQDNARKEEEPVPQPAVAVEKEQMIYGTLVDTQNRPVMGTITLSGGKSLQTDEYGVFHMTSPPAGATQVHYAIDAGSGLGRGFIWTADDDANNLVVVLEPLAMISGRVVDGSGNGVREGKIKIMVGPLPGVASINTPAELWKANVAVDGRFSFEGVPVGLPMTVLVERDGFKTGAVVIGALDAGKTADVGNIVLRKIREDEEPQSEAGSGKLSGVVFNDSGKPVTGLSVSCTVGADIVEAVTDANGRYHLSGLPAGEQVRLQVGGNEYDAVCDGNDLDIHLPAEQR